MNSVYVNDLVFNGASTFIVPKNMEVNRPSTLHGDVEVKSALNVEGTLTGDLITSSSLDVTGTATLPTINSTSLITATSSTTTNAGVTNLNAANATMVLEVLPFFQVLQHKQMS